MEEKNVLKSAYRKMKIGMKDFKKIQKLLLYQEQDDNF